MGKSIDVEDTDSAQPRAQRGGRRGGLTQKLGQEDRAAQVLAQKNLSLAQLIYFYKKREQEGRLNAKMTCWEVVRDVIIPETEGAMCCYVDIVLGSPKKPDVMVSHWWGGNFRELVLGVAQHATGILGRDLLEKKTFTGGLNQLHLEKTYWIGIFACNHHKKKSEGHPVLEVSTLSNVLSQMKSLVLVVDKDFIVLTRAWCMFEVFQASNCGKEVDFAAGGELDKGRSTGNIAFEGLEFCAATETSDKDRLWNYCQLEIGALSFKNAVEDIVVPGVQGLAIAQALREGDRATLCAILESRADVNPRVTKHGDTPLNWACQHAKPELVKLLLDSKANPNLPTVGGWAPIHYAVQEGCEELARALLTARANAGCAAQNSRTPLVDAAERGYWSIASLLLDAKANPLAIDMNGNTAVSFVKDFNNPELVAIADRLGWTASLAQRGRGRSSTC